MFCPECGANIPDDSVFCSECGMKIEINNGIYSAEQQDATENKGKGGRKSDIFWSALIVILALSIVGGLVYSFVKKDTGDDKDIGVSEAYTKPNEYEESEYEESEYEESEYEENEYANSFYTGGDSSNVLDSLSAESGENLQNEEYNIENIEGIIDVESSRTVEKMNSIASALSTDRVPNAEDFGWFLDLEAGLGNGEGDFIRNNEVERIMYEQNLLLNGGWSVFLVDTISKPFDPIVERFATADIQTEGEDFNMILKLNTVFFPHEGETYEENENHEFIGAWDAVTGTVKAQSEYLSVEFDNFYITEDDSAELATGTFYWPSGEVERIALIRYTIHKEIEK